MKRIWLFPLAVLPVCFFVLFIRGLKAQDVAAGLAAARYAEDVNHDGTVNIADVAALVRLSRENLLSARSDFNGDGRVGLLDALVLLLRISRSDFHPLPAVASEWKVLGPGGGGGMFIPTVDPFDPGHVVLVCDMTGAYVTFDDGASWKMFNLRTGVADFEFDPLNQGVVYAANTALWRSEDGGRGWSLVWPATQDVTLERMVGDHAEQSFLTSTGLPDAELDKVRVDPADGSHIYIGLGQWWNGPAKVLYSRDRGASWRTLAAVPGQQIMAIFPGSWWDKPDEALIVTDAACIRASETTGDTVSVPLPDSPVLDADGGKGTGTATLYVLTALRKSGQSFAGGMHRSTDLGATWTRIDSNLTSSTETPTYNTLAVCQENPSVVYLSCTSFPTNRIGIFKTSDSGNSWKWVLSEDWSSYVTNNMKDAWLTREYGHGYVGAPFGLGVCARDTNTCYASAGNSFRTRDGGKSWEAVYSDEISANAWTSRGLDVTTCYGVHFDPFDPQHLFITYTDIGLFHSFNGGEGWIQSLNGVPEPWWNTCYWLEFDPAVKDRVYSVWGNGHDLPRLKMFRRPGFADRFQGGVAISDDGGRTWRASVEGIPENTDCSYILLDPSSPPEARVLYVSGTGRGVFKSTDSGRTWKTANNGLGGNLYSWEITRLPDGALYLIVMRALDDNGRTIPGELYVSRDGADSWQKVDLPADVSGPNSLTFDPSDPRRLYLSCWPLPVNRVEKGGGLLLSEDSGVSWRRVFREDAHVYASAVDPADPSVVVINTFDSAAFRSEDRGTSWKRLGGYNFKWGQRPIFDPVNPGMLYLTTFGGSVYHGPATGAPGAFEDIENLPDSMRWQD